MTRVRLYPHLVLLTFPFKYVIMALHTSPVSFPSYIKEPIAYETRSQSAHPPLASYYQPPSSYILPCPFPYVLIGDITP